MSSNLVNAIRKAIKINNNDEIFIFTGQVVNTDSAYIDGTIMVFQTTGIVSSIIQEKDPIYSFNQQNSAIYNGKTSTELLNSQAGNLPFTVDLQPQVGDTLFIVPTIGSYVTVVYSTYQNPFVIGFQDADIYSNAVYDTYHIMDEIGQTFSSGDTSLNITPNNINYIIDTNTTFNITSSLMNYGINNGASFSLSTTFDLKSANGSEISGDNLISIKNSSSNLSDILQNLNSALQSLINILGTPILYGVPNEGYSTPPVYTSLEPIINTLSEVSSDLTNLLQ